MLDVLCERSVRPVLAAFLGPEELARCAVVAKAFVELQQSLRRCYLSCPRRTKEAVLAHLMHRWHCLPYRARSAEDIAFRKRMTSRKTPRRYYAGLMSTLDFFWVDTRKDFPFEEFTRHAQSQAQCSCADAEGSCGGSNDNRGDYHRSCRDLQVPETAGDDAAAHKLEHQRCRRRRRRRAGPIVSHTEVEWMLTHKDKLASNLQAYYAPEVARLIHPESYTLTRGASSRGEFLLPHGIGKRLFETRITGKPNAAHDGAKHSKRGKKKKSAARKDPESLMDALSQWKSSKPHSKVKSSKSKPMHSKSTVQSAPSTVNNPQQHRWIVKPATDSCGHGIQIFDGDQVCCACIYASSQRPPMHWYCRSWHSS